MNDKKSIRVVPPKHEWRASIRSTAKKVRPYRASTIICVLENPANLLNVGSVIRTVNALGISKIYIVGDFNQ